MEWTKWIGKQAGGALESWSGGNPVFRLTDPLGFVVEDSSIRAEPSWVNPSQSCTLKMGSILRTFEKREKKKSSEDGIALPDTWSLSRSFCDTPVPSVTVRRWGTWPYPRFLLWKFTTFRVYTWVCGKQPCTRLCSVVGNGICGPQPWVWRK